ncbi:MAG TPA: antitoxin Xre-like helix-turn-helix domain-containing protein [Stellaceae bacterium]|nr:antitoxin Xre-like helix-turn-helix domain-containing protein [Stellaceae bacterium]
MSGFANAIGPVVEIDPSSGPPNLADPAVRARLTSAAVGAAVRLAEIWRLSNAEICALLGDTSERTWFRIKRGEWSGALSHDALTRISTLIGIFKGLRLLFSEPLSDEWVRLPNKGPLYGGGDRSMQ